MYNKAYYYKDERGFIVPFVLGGLFGGALTATWPKNNYNYGYNQYPNQMNFNPYMPAANYSYSYYVPQYVPNPSLYNTVNY